jgi:hypothetical protein
MGDELTDLGTARAIRTSAEVNDCAFVTYEVFLRPVMLDSISQSATRVAFCMKQR